MDAKSDDTIFMGYALTSKAYKDFNKTSFIVEESIHVVFYETNVAPRKGIIVDNGANIEDQNIEESKEKKQEDTRKIHPWKSYKERKINMMISPKTWNFVKDHPIGQVIGDLIQVVKTRWALKETCEYATYISQLELKNFKEAENEES